MKNHFLLEAKLINVFQLNSILNIYSLHTFKLQPEIFENNRFPHQVKHVFLNSPTHHRFHPESLSRTAQKEMKTNLKTSFMAVRNRNVLVRGTFTYVKESRLGRVLLLKPSSSVGREKLEKHVLRS